MMNDNNEQVLFDPGFNPLLRSFSTIYLEFYKQFKKNKQFAIKRKIFKLNSSLLEKSIKETVGFWKGCMLWATYIKYSNLNSPKTIIGSDMNDEAELKKYFLNQEFEIISHYFASYSENCEKFLEEKKDIPALYLEIFEDYKEFCSINDCFISLNKTSELKLPQKYEKEYSQQELDEIINKINLVLQSKNLAEFLI